MKKGFLFFLMMALLSGLCSSKVCSQKKLTQTGFEFLVIGQDTRATAMGETFTAVEGFSLVHFYSPAGMSRVSFFLDLTLSHNKWIADITHYSSTTALTDVKQSISTAMDKSKAPNVFAELGSGLLLGVLFAVPAGFIGSRLSKGEGLEDIGVITYSMYGGYTVGSSLGVHIVAKAKKGRTSFLGTLAAGAVGSALGAAAFFASDQKGIASGAPLIAPIIGSIVYVHLIE